jgi:hypothetical protein
MIVLDRAEGEATVRVEYGTGEVRGGAQGSKMRSWYEGRRWLLVVKADEDALSECLANNLGKLSSLVSG